MFCTALVSAFFMAITLLYCPSLLITHSVNHVCVRTCLAYPIHRLCPMMAKRGRWAMRILRVMRSDADVLPVDCSVTVYLHDASFASPETQQHRFCERAIVCMHVFLLSLECLCTCHTMCVYACARVCVDAFSLVLISSVTRVL